MELKTAIIILNEFSAGFFFQVLLYEETGKDKYKQDIESTFQDWMPGGSVPYSPQGLAFRSQWGSLRYTCEEKSN